MGDLDLDELDRLHAAADMTGIEARADGFGTCELHARADMPPVASDVNAYAASAIVALHNAWPEVSARLRAAEVVLRALVACDDAIAAGREPPTSRHELAEQARAALGEP